MQCLKLFDRADRALNQRGEQLHDQSLGRGVEKSSDRSLDLASVQVSDQAIPKHQNLEHRSHKDGSLYIKKERDLLININNYFLVGNLPIWEYACWYILIFLESYILIFMTMLLCIEEDT